MASWFTEGTVSVTNGQTIVTGASTKFSNCRPGDMFVGPDMGIYQVVNPGSDISVSISPAYRGATAVGALYGIVPVNGYPKALADTFSQISQQWGTTLAGLGPVAGMTVVSVGAGGTGNTTGQAATASKLATPRNINGVPFDGTASISISASSVWGQIAGALSAQTDLQAVLTGLQSGLQASINAKMSIPTSGEFSPFNSTADLYLPAGGTYAWWLYQANTTSGAIAGSCSGGVSAGGTKIKTAVAGQVAFGWYWRVA